MARSRAMSSTMWRLSPTAGSPPMGTERSRQLPGDAQFGDLPVPDGVLAAVAEARALGQRIRPADQPARPRPGLAGPTRRTIACIRRSRNLARRRRPGLSECTELL